MPGGYAVVVLFVITLCRLPIGFYIFISYGVQLLAQSCSGALQKFHDDQNPDEGHRMGGCASA